MATVTEKVEESLVGTEGRATAVVADAVLKVSAHTSMLILISY